MKINFLESKVNPQIRFLGGILTFPAIFLSINSIWLIPISCGIGIVALLTGFKIRFRSILNFTLMICFFYLLSPVGRVLFSIPWFYGHSFPVTLGALVMGLKKASFLLALVFLSGASISSDIYIPGKWGKGIRQVFIYYNNLLNNRKKINLKQPVVFFDNILLNLDNLEELETLNKEKIGVNRWAVLYFLIVFSVGWGGALLKYLSLVKV